MNVTSTPPEIHLVVRPDLFPGILSDQSLTLVGPFVAYWSLSLLFEAFDHFNWLEKYRIHTPVELSSRNKCSRFDVFKAVILQQFVQTLFAAGLNYFEPPQYTGREEYDLWVLATNLHTSRTVASVIYYGIVPLAKMIMAFLILDTWQYMWHRVMHMNKWLYRNFHSVHHRLYVPYAFGALYNSLVEGFLLDTFGAGLAYLIMGLSTREAAVFFTFSTLKTVDDHCGYELPWDPLQLVFPNNSVYHDIHHQSFGIKTNFSQPFFVHWDEILNTKYKDTSNYIEQQRIAREQRYNAAHQKKTQ